jgi:hypothetical protein
VAGTGCGDRHLGRRELCEAFQQVGLSSRWTRIWRGPRWWVQLIKTRLRGDAPFSFPMVVAQRH